MTDTSYFLSVSLSQRN